MILAAVGAGLPAKGPALLANFPPPFTVAAATVFAGKPAPTGGAIGWILRQARDRKETSLAQDMRCRCSVCLSGAVLMHACQLPFQH
ncbi:hypothetical protein CBP06_24530 [Pseudomonas putida]|nr:hypothetical protein CBP06_24530 [Pseudomonas putida]